MLSFNTGQPRTDNYLPDLTVHGDIDVATSPMLRQALLEAITTCPSDRVLVDLSDVSFMDSTGLGAFVSAQNQAKESGRKIAFLLPTERILNLLEITGLVSVFEIVGLEGSD